MRYVGDRVLKIGPYGSKQIDKGRVECTSLKRFPLGAPTYWQNTVRLATNPQDGKVSARSDVGVEVIARLGQNNVRCRHSRRYELFEIISPGGRPEDGIHSCGLFVLTAIGALDVCQAGGRNPESACQSITVTGGT